MNPTRHGTWLSFAAAVLLGISTAVAQETDEMTVDRERWTKLYQEVAQRMKVSVGEFGAATPKSEPFFSWANPVREGRTAGDFFIWFAHDRPVLVGTIFSYDSPPTDHSQRAVVVELQGLSNQPVEIQYAPHFQHRLPGNSVEQSRLKHTSPPRERRVQRLTEMRRIASRVEASTDLDGKRIPLRLLPTPLYRFEGPEMITADEKVLDGAIFAMVTGTDPELLLIVQALRGDDDEIAWFLTTAGFTNLPLTVEVDGESVSERGSANDNPLYFAQRIHVVPTTLEPSVDALLGP